MSVTPRTSQPVTCVPSAALKSVRSSAIRELLAFVSKPGVLSMAGGLPASECLPVDRLTEAAAKAMAAPDGLQYGATAGSSRLREILADKESRLQDRDRYANEILVTHGSQQALALVAQAIVNPNDVVVVDDPVFTGAMQAFELVQANLVGVPIGSEGTDLDALEELLQLGTRPKVVHTVTTFHNPRGVVMPESQRRRLADLAERYGFWVFEDDPYRELYYAEEPPVPLASYSDRVIHFGSVSKILAPALRVGWACGPRDLIVGAEMAKQGNDVCGSTYSHEIVADLLSDVSWIDGHIAMLRSVYGERAKAMTAALGNSFGDVLECSPAQGGMFVWARFTDGTDVVDLAHRSIENGAVFVPGGAFSIYENHFGDSARLCFVTNSVDELSEAVARIHKTWLEGHTP